MESSFGNTFRNKVKVKFVIFFVRTIGITIKKSADEKPVSTIQ